MVLVLFGGFFLAVGVFATALIMAAFGLLFMIIGIPLTYQGIIQGGIRFLSNELQTRQSKERKHRRADLKRNLPRQESLVLPSRNESAPA